mgnify:CR=1 FL=1
MKKSLSSITKKIVLTIVVIFPLISVPLILDNTSGVSATTHETYKNLEIFSNVLSLIQKNYVEEVDTTEVLQGAIKGMLVSLDPHSSYLKPDDFKELKVETKGSFSGIGIEITIKDGILTVVSPIEDTPAFKKGLKAGDRIIKIEGEFTKDMSLMDAVKKLRGPKGSAVTISVHRQGWNQLKKVTITRGVIPLHSVKTKIMEAGYLYIRISNFQSKTTNDFKKELRDFAANEKIKGLILDLRNNPGGLLAQAVKVSDIFIDEGVIVSTKGRIKEQNMGYKAHSGGIDHDFPIVVLVNEGSASASEIVAGALQDHKIALIVGTQTFGKGSVQTIIPMSNGAGLRLTTARYYTPNGTSIQAKGITPDIMVENFIIDEEQTKNRRSRTLLREKDLKHHLTNGETPPEKEEEEVQETLENEEQEVQDLNGKGTEEETGKEEESIEELLDKDQQLTAALRILKGLNVLKVK